MFQQTSPLGFTSVSNCLLDVSFRDFRWSKFLTHPNVIPTPTGCFQMSLFPPSLFFFPSFHWLISFWWWCGIHLGRTNISMFGVAQRSCMSGPVHFYTFNQLPSSPGPYVFGMPFLSMQISTLFFISYLQFSLSQTN